MVGFSRLSWVGVKGSIEAPCSPVEADYGQ
jgi:hypothetical protein